MRTLDAAKDCGTLNTTARNLVANASADELPLLAEEVKPYLEAAGQPSDWVEDEICSASPTLKAARAELSKRERELIKSTHNARIANEANETGHIPDARLFIDPT